MSTILRGHNRVRSRRTAHGWSQAELAERAGISRAAVSAIEGCRLVPSVAAALALASVLECSVEELFSHGSSSRPEAASTWAWSPPHPECRTWYSEVNGRVLTFPVEVSPLGEVPHDGIGLTELTGTLRHLAESTLVMASCDPAVGLLARIYEQSTGFRLLVLPRSSRQALGLLNERLIHVAGVHLSAANRQEGNLQPVKEIVSQPACLLRVAAWEDGIAVGSGVTAHTVRGLLRNRLTWIGREAGSGARQCLDELLEDRPAPRRLARDHRGVADAIRCGWADAGVCLRLVAEEAALRFFAVRTEGYDLCFSTRLENDPRLRSLVQVVRSSAYRRLLRELPGYDAAQAGAITRIE